MRLFAFGRGADFAAKVGKVVFEYENINLGGLHSYRRHNFNSIGAGQPSRQGRLLEGHSALLKLGAFCEAGTQLSASQPEPANCEIRASFSANGIPSPSPIVGD